MQAINLKLCLQSFMNNKLLCFVLNWWFAAKIIKFLKGACKLKIPWETFEKFMKFDWCARIISRLYITPKGVFEDVYEAAVGNHQRLLSLWKILKILS